MVVHEYLRYLVIESRLVSYEYFMDDITEWEINMLVPMAIDCHKTAWETARYISYNNAVMSGNLKKQYVDKGMHELFPLPYDKQIDEHNIEMTNKERDILKQRAERLKMKMFNKKKQSNTNG